MPRRLVIATAVCAVMAGGCARISPERLNRLEAAADSVERQEIRLTLLEDRVNAYHAKDVAPLESETPPQPPVPAQKKGAQQAAKQPAPQKSAPAATEKPPVSRAVKAAPKGSGNPARDYQQAFATLERGKPDAALPLFAGFLERYPSHKLAPNAEYWLGECHYSAKRYQDALNVFKDVVAKYPEDPKAAAAMLKAGYSYDLLGDKNNARFYLEAVSRDFSGTAPAKLAAQRLASL